MSAGTTLPKRVDPRRLAVACGEIEGVIPLASLPRLSAATLAPPAEAKAWLKLAFAEDAQRRVTMRGRLQAVLSLQCQRCLGSLAWTV
ncbi:MAG: hypothetical protein L0H83_13825, partial [Salinisphaera sp.]|nr:hypothetical protein [Salinisphaera sp.]